MLPIKIHIASNNSDMAISCTEASLNNDDHTCTQDSIEMESAVEFEEEYTEMLYILPASFASSEANHNPVDLMPRFTTLFENADVAAEDEDEQNICETEVRVVHCSPYLTVESNTSQLCTTMALLRNFLHHGFINAFSSCINYLENKYPDKLEYTVIKNIYLADWYRTNGNTQEALQFCDTAEDLLGSVCTGKDMLTVRHLTTKGFLMLEMQQNSGGKKYLTQAAELGQMQVGNQASAYAYQAFGTQGLIHWESTDLSLELPDDKTWKDAANFLRKSCVLRNSCDSDLRISRFLSNKAEREHFFWSFVIYILTLLRSSMSDHWYRIFMEQCTVSDSILAMVSQHLQYVKDHWQDTTFRIQVYYHFARCDLLVRRSMVEASSGFDHICQAMSLLKKALRRINICQNLIANVNISGVRCLLKKYAKTRVDFLMEKIENFQEKNHCTYQQNIGQIQPKEKYPYVSQSEINLNLSLRNE